MKPRRRDLPGPAGMRSGAGRALLGLALLGLALLGLALLLSASGCAAVTGGQELPDAQPDVVAPSSAPVPVASAPRLGATTKVNFLTGEDLPDAQILAVKIDNTSAARPQAGLPAADVVYVEEVEAGATRLLAVFQTELPAQVGPVRSARTSDIDILGSYGAAGFAFSGGNSGVVGQLQDSPLVLASFDTSGTGFARSSSRSAPYNVLGDGPALLARAAGAAVAPDVGFRFGAAPAGGRAVSGASYAWSAALIDFEYSESSNTWRQGMDGRPTETAEGGPVEADTVVFQAVPVVPSPYVDVNGARSPEVSPIGEGEVTVLRDGQAHAGTWSRPDVASPTAFTAADGSELAFTTGQTWVVYIATGGAPTLR